MNQGITGRLIQAGRLTDTNGDTVHGLLIECDRETLMDNSIPLYRTVSIMHSQTPPEYILSFFLKHLSPENRMKVRDLFMAENRTSQPGQPGQ